MKAPLTVSGAPARQTAWQVAALAVLWALAGGLAVLAAQAHGWPVPGAAGALAWALAAAAALVLACALARRLAPSAPAGQRDPLALARSEQQLRAVLDNATLAVFLMDEQQRCVFMNAAAEQLSGYSLAQTAGRPLHDVVHHTRPDGRPYPLHECPIDQAFPARSRMQGEEVFVHADGSFYPVAFTASPVQDDAGKPVGTVVEVRDLRAERAQQQALLTEQQQLRDSEARFRAIQETSIDGFMVLESVRDAAGAIADFRWTYANAAAERIVGRPVAWFIGQRLLQAMPGNRDAGLFDAYVRVVETGEPWTTEVTYQLDGVDVYLRIVAARVGDGFAVSFADLSATRRAEQQVHDSEQRLQIAMEATQSGVFEWNLQSQSVHWTSGHYTVLGLQPDGEPASYALWRRHVHADDIARVEAAVQATLASGERFAAQYRVLRADGQLRWVQGSGLLVQAAGGPRRMVGAIVDITQQKAAEEAARASASEFVALANSVPALVWTADAQGGWDFLNDQWTAYAGSAGQTAPGQGWLGLLHPEDSGPMAQGWQAAVASGQPFERESRLRDADGNFRWFMCRAVPQRDAQGRIRRWFGTCTDIDAAKATERRLRAQDLQLREADRRKDEFLATLAHELRNPLAPVRTAASLLRRPGLASEQHDWAVRVIESQVATMALLLDDLLEVSRITQGKLQLKLELLDLRSVLDSALEAARPAIDRRGHRLLLSLPPGAVPVMGDALRLAQVFANLLGNAAKYMDAGGQVQLLAQLQGTAVEVSVRDEGIGLAPESLDSIFGMFSQVESARHRADGGMGIGLAMVRGLVALHGGSVQARSAGLGQGSEFLVRLPLAATSPTAPVAPPLARPAAVPTLRVLVADDNRDAADSLAMMLAIDGHAVRTAYDGLQAVALADAQPPDVAFIDVGMPGLSGHEVAQALQSRPWRAGATLVALTGWGSSDDQRSALDAGFDLHLTKPADPQALHAVLARHTQARQAAAAPPGPGTA